MFDEPKPMSWWQKALLVAITALVIGYAGYWVDGCAKALGL